MDEKITIKEYADATAKYISGILGDEYEIEIKPLSKNNKVLTGLSVFKNDIGIAIHLDHFYADYKSGKHKSLSESMDAVYDYCKKSFKEEELHSSVPVEPIVDYKRAKKMLRYKLVGIKGNEALLARSVHEEFPELGIAKIYYLLVGRKNGSINLIILTDDIMKAWNYKSLDDSGKGVEPEEVKDRTNRNMLNYDEAVIITTKDMGKAVGIGVKDWMKVSVLGTDKASLREKIQGDGGGMEHMVTLTTWNCTNGAAAMLYPGVLAKIANALEKNFIILPSSISEVMLCQTDSCDKDEIQYYVNLVKNTNSAGKVVVLDEVLVNGVYYYDRKTDKLTFYD